MGCAAIKMPLSREFLYLSLYIGFEHSFRNDLYPEPKIGL